MSVREHHTAAEWAKEIKYLVDTSYPGKEKIILVMDNPFPAQEARRIARKLEIHYTPKHGSLLDMAGIELNVMTKQCLSQRIADIEELRQELAKRTATMQAQASTGTLQRAMPRRNCYPSIQSSRHQFQNRELICLNINVLLH